MKQAKTLIHFFQVMVALALLSGGTAHALNRLVNYDFGTNTTTAFGTWAYTANNLSQANLKDGCLNDGALDASALLGGTNTMVAYYTGNAAFGSFAQNTSERKNRLFQTFSIPQLTPGISSTNVNVAGKFQYCTWSDLANYAQGMSLDIFDSAGTTWKAQLNCMSLSTANGAGSATTCAPKAALAYSNGAVYAAPGSTSSSTTYEARMTGHFIANLGGTKKDGQYMDDIYVNMAPVNLFGTPVTGTVNVRLDWSTSTNPGGLTTTAPALETTLHEACVVLAEAGHPLQVGGDLLPAHGVDLVANPVGRVCENEVSLDVERREHVTTVAVIQPHATLLVVGLHGNSTP